MISATKLCVAAALVLPCASVGWAQKTDDAKDIGIEEHLGRQVPLGATFLDETGSEVELRDLVDKPTILTLVYYECPGICTPLLNGLTEVLGKLPLTAGKDYQVLSISFDPTETPKMARGKKQNYLKQIKKEFAEDGWRFMTGEEENIQRVCEAVGFKYTQEGEDYVHGAVLTILTPEGRIARYLYGISFLPFELQMALTEAAAGQTGPSVNRVLLYCFSYDPSGRKYLLNVTRLVGIVTVLFAGAFGLWLFMSGRNQRHEGDPRLRRAGGGTASSDRSDRSDRSD